MEILDLLLDTFLESLLIFAFLYAIYILMEFIESRGESSRLEKVLQSKYAPLLGGAFGIVPECGFSVASAKLYDNGFIRTGTLLAVFLASSDEGLIVLISGISQGVLVTDILLLIALKIMIAALAGIVINFLLRNKETVKYGTGEIACPECHEETEGKVKRFIVHPLLHALKVFAFVLIVNIAFALIIYFIGEENLENFINASKWLQPVVTPLVGLIPNCASSSVIAGLYVNHGLTFAGLLSGLLSNAGLGITVLFRNKKKIKSAILILLFLYLFSVAVGIIATLFV